MYLYSIESPISIAVRFPLVSCPMPVLKILKIEKKVLVIPHIYAFVSLDSHAEPAKLC